VALCPGNIALALAPKGQATSYLAVNALASGLAATTAPIIAGATADWFGARELSLTLRWASDLPAATELDFGVFSLRGLDFLFLIAVFIGLWVLRWLRDVSEKGEIEESVAVTEFYAEARTAVRDLSNVAGLRHLTYFPFGSLLRTLQRNRATAERDPEAL